MPQKLELTWSRRDDDTGRRVQVCAVIYEGAVSFTEKTVRHEQWVPVLAPSPAHWEALAEVIAREGTRRHLSPETQTAIAKRVLAPPPKPPKKPRDHFTSRPPRDEA